ncbi:hypothetical protein SPHINGO361_50025 [Sphingomonas sp. EC-HK361]|nr:hypothetical protein SPHINGO361_50025 [Sphingomonas sp. EC-HK361]
MGTRIIGEFLCHAAEIGWHVPGTVKSENILYITLRQPVWPQGDQPLMAGLPAQPAGRRQASRGIRALHAVGSVAPGARQRAPMVIAPAGQLVKNPASFGGVSHVER